MGLKWSEKFPKVKTESNCVPGQEEEEILICSGTRLADLLAQFSLRRPGNSQRDGHPRLVFHSHVMALHGPGSGNTKIHI